MNVRRQKQTSLAEIIIIVNDELRLIEELPEDPLRSDAVSSYLPLLIAAFTAAC